MNKFKLIIITVIINCMFCGNFNARLINNELNLSKENYSQTRLTFSIRYDELY